MKIYSSYTTLIFLKIFLIMVGSLTLTATLVQVMLFLSVSINSIDLDIFSTAKFMLLCLSSNFVQVAPIALICTILYFFQILSSDNELLIFELSGLSKYRLALPAFSVMLGTMILSMFLSFFVNPACKKLLLLQRETLHKSMINSGLKEKTFVKISKKLMLYIDKRIDAKNLSGVVIYEKINPSDITTIFASRGSFSDESDKAIFKLHDGSRQTLKDQKLQTLYFKSLIFDVSEYTKKMADFHKELDALPMYKLIKLRKRSENSLPFQKRIAQEIHGRIAWPLLNISLPLLFLFSAVSFGDGRSKNLNKLNIAISVFLATLCMVSYFLLINRISTTAGFSILIYLNIISFAMLGLFLLNLVVKQKPLLRF